MVLEFLVGILEPVKVAIVMVQGFVPQGLEVNRAIEDFQSYHKDDTSLRDLNGITIIRRRRPSRRPSVEIGCSFGPVKTRDEGVQGRLLLGICSC